MCHLPLLQTVLQAFDQSIGRAQMGVLASRLVGDIDEHSLVQVETIEFEVGSANVDCQFFGN